MAHRSMAIQLRSAVFVLMSVVALCVLAQLLTVSRRPQVVTHEQLLQSIQLSARNDKCQVKSQLAGTRYEQLQLGRLFIALNLHENDDIAPDMIVQLHRVIDHVGPQNVFVSVYESASLDGTKTYVALLDMLLSLKNVEHRISTTDMRRPDTEHRIAYLAKVRNHAMQPLYDKPHGTWDRVVFMNDVIFCAEDVWELLTHKADMVCGLDYDTPNDQPAFYDTWAARNVLGGIFGKSPVSTAARHEQSNQALQENRPFQVQCCWNGIVVLNARVFETIRFRHEDTAVISESDERRESLAAKNPAMNQFYTSCSSSEVNHLCTDMQLAGFNKAVVVPRVQVAYDYRSYSIVHLKQPDMPFSAAEDAPLDFKDTPRKTECHPMSQLAVRDPDGPVGLLLY